jgi:hypothetical protein
VAAPKGPAPLPTPLPGLFPLLKEVVGGVSSVAGPTDQTMMEVFMIGDDPALAASILQLVSTMPATPI